jgi:iron complex transport system ATP-binding protein
MYEARGIRVIRRGRAIVDGADLTLHPGKVVALVGPNGAGKSTLLKTMAGEIAANGGEILLDGKSLALWHPAELARRRAVLPQSASISFPFTVSEIVALGSLKRLVRRESDALVSRALSAVDLPGFAHRFYDELSGGERQRVQLARVFVQLWSGDDAPFLMLDEPTTNLDLSHQLLTLDLAREHAGKGGGVLCVLHDLNLAAMVADEIVALKEGRVIASGPPETVVTDALIAMLYGVKSEVGGVPKGPFLLPQTLSRGPSPSL